MQTQPANLNGSKINQIDEEATINYQAPEE